MGESLERLRERIKRSLEVYNPWWSNPEWYKDDQLVQEYMKGDIKVISRLYYHIRNNITKDKYGIVTIRGPRRCGKTTMIKLVIRDLIENHSKRVKLKRVKPVKPVNIYYISLDYGGLKDVRLFEILRVIASEGDEEKYVFIDEASMYEDWALDLKNAVDAGMVSRGKLKIVVTGSHSMDLAKAASHLRGRQGDLAQVFNLGGNLLYTPLRFPEVVEGVKKEINRVLSSKEFRKPKFRFNLLKELGECKIGRELEEIYNSCFSILNQLFENYLVHGGYPKAVKEFYTAGKISKQLYTDLAELLVKDTEKAGLKPNILKQILSEIVNPSRKRISGLLDPKGIKPPNLRDEEFWEYIEYLTSTWSIFLSYQERRDASCEPNYEAQRKLYILDPFILHALYSYLNDIPNPLEKSVELLSNEDYRGLLVESVVASHLLLAQQLFEHVPHVEYSKVLMYGKPAEGPEVDFVLCINKGNERYRFLIESKYRESVAGTIKPHQYRSLIVLTKDTLDVDEERRIVYIPTPLFLMLF